MATFYNQATLVYNGNTTTSNITTGELLEVLSATKTAVVDRYIANDSITYIISIINSGSTAFSNLTLTDDLGAYELGGLTLRPLTHVDDSVQYFVNGILQATPAVAATAPLTVTGISVPANGNATIIYQTKTNEFTPLEADASITNTGILSGNGLSTDLLVSDTIYADTSAVLTISKSIYPTTVTENGQITYTFVIQNSGNTAATADDDIVVTDTFDPVLNAITVTFNGAAWSAPAHYVYSEATGVFSTVTGAITVPAATYTRDETTGAVTVNPGVSVLTVTGTI